MGDVVITSAGRLPVRYVLHAVTLDRERAIKPTIQTIRLHFHQNCVLAFSDELVPPRTSATTFLRY
jgi:O-acetyl-ADP-ribose deacetylase (regulator of RNase III)